MKYLGNLDELKNDGIYNDPPVKRITSGKLKSLYPI